MSAMKPWSKVDHPLLPWSFVDTGDDMPAVMPTEAADRAVRGVNYLEFPNEMIAAAEAETARLRAQGEAMTALMQEHLKMRGDEARQLIEVANERDAARDEAADLVRERDEYQARYYRADERCTELAEELDTLRARDNLNLPKAEVFYTEHWAEAGVDGTVHAIGDDMSLDDIRATTASWIALLQDRLARPGQSA